MLTTNALFAFHFILFDLFVLCASIGQDNYDDYDDDDLSLKIRRISSGIIRGRRIPISSAGGGNAFLFAAVPYARAPSANLRFQPPQPPEPWDGVRDATERGPSCWWNTLGFATDDASLTPMDEDCLRVNVFASERCVRLGGCAVLHYIYGGQFMFGSARKLDERTIAENFCSPGRDVVVVTFDYRMNVFGLLSLNFHFSDVNPPNMAIHDIVASLHWTQKEIVNFGGDPKRVTLAGHSSGSVASQILMLIPRTNHLFDQTISMSGPGTIEMLPKNRNERSSRRLALEVGCATFAEWNSTKFWMHRENITRVLDCLRTLPARRLSEALPLLERKSVFFHGLSMEVGPGAIINDTFDNLIRCYSGKHRVLTGTVSKEFLDGMVLIQSDTDRVDKVRLALYCRRLVRQLNYENGEKALSECVYEYDDVQKAPLLSDDVSMFVPHLLFATVFARRGLPTFLYQFEYDGIGIAFQYAPGRFGSPTELSPRHVQDLVYLFGQNKGIFSARDRRLQQLHSALFVNFIRNGTLNGGDIQNALPFSPNRSNFYRIDFVNSNNQNEFAGDIDGYHRRAVDFWTEQMPKVAGRKRLLRDELMIDDQMLSKYLPADLALFERLVGPWVEAERHNWFWWQCLLLFCCWVSVLLLLLLLATLPLLLIALHKRKRRFVKQSKSFNYDTIN